MSQIKTSELSSVDALTLSSVYFVVLDEQNTVQTSSGSTVKINGNDVALSFWGLSSDYIPNINYSSSLSASWQNTTTVVNSNSSSWATSVPSGGSTNQILQKNSSTDNDASWKNKRTTVTLPTLSGSGLRSISSNALSADQFVVLLSGASLSAAIEAPTNPYDSQIIMWNLRYVTNILGVSAAPNFRLPITTLQWSISSSRMDIMTAKYNLLDNKWDVIGFSPGYII
jgi:hypothetical protein